VPVSRAAFDADGGGGGALTIDLEQVRRHRNVLLAARDLPAKLAQCSARIPTVRVRPDFALYDGFISDEDRRRCEQVRRTPPERLAHLARALHGRTARRAVFPLSRAHWPQTLSALERARWDAWRRARVRDPRAG